VKALPEWRFRVEWVSSIDWTGDIWSGVTAQTEHYHSKHASQGIGRKS
jgi:hypothetical protein